MRSRTHSLNILTTDIPSTRQGKLHSYHDNLTTPSILFSYKYKGVEVLTLYTCNLKHSQKLKELSPIPPQVTIVMDNKGKIKEMIQAAGTIWISLQVLITIQSLSCSGLSYLAIWDYNLVKELTIQTINYILSLKSELYEGCYPCNGYQGDSARYRPQGISHEVRFNLGCQLRPQLVHWVVFDFRACLLCLKTKTIENIDE